MPVRPDCDKALITVRVVEVELRPGTMSDLIPPFRFWPEHSGHILFSVPGAISTLRYARDRRRPSGG
jgi:hypothetical protein